MMLQVNRSLSSYGRMVLKTLVGPKFPMREDIVVVIYLYYNLGIANIKRELVGLNALDWRKGVD